MAAIRTINGCWAFDVRCWMFPAFKAYPAGGGFCPTGREAADLALSLARTEGNRAGSGQPESLREKAIFWLGAARGRRGYGILRRIVTEDSSDRIREKAIFALSISKEPQALDTMIAVARNDASSHVRGQALFWLAQKAGKKAVGAISGAIDNDPDTEVKKKAVFA